MSDTKNISVKEFKMWIQGVEEMQEDENWTPSPKQWARIRAKIELLADSGSSSSSSSQSVLQVSQAPMPPQSNQGSGIVYRESATASTTSALPVVPPSKIPENVPFAIDSKVPVKSPSIDTSDGNYKSPFGV